MSDSLTEFFKIHPVLTVIIIVFMVLPMIGAVSHVILKAFGKKGIDNSPPATLPPVDDGAENKSDKK